MMSAGFWRHHLLLPLLAFITLATLLEQSQFDLQLASAIYHWEGQAWVLRRHWLLSTVLHSGMRTLIVAIAVLLLAGWGRGIVDVRARRYQRGLGYLLASMVVSVSLVSLGKHLSGVDCPWSLAPFGGALEYVPIFTVRPEGMPAAQCFPAGHASAGYGWLGLYFLCYHYRPYRRGWALLGVLSLGAVLGGVQQLRGAHFLSHDLWTLGICWLVATLLYPLLLGRRRRPEPVATAATVD